MNNKTLIIDQEYLVFLLLSSFLKHIKVIDVNDEQNCML